MCERLACVNTISNFEFPAQFCRLCACMLPNQLRFIRYPIRKAARRSQLHGQTKLWHVTLF